MVLVIDTADRESVLQAYWLLRRVLQRNRWPKSKSVSPPSRKSVQEPDSQSSVPALKTKPELFQEFWQRIGLNSRRILVSALKIEKTSWTSDDWAAAAGLEVKTIRATIMNMGRTAKILGFSLWDSTWSHVHLRTSYSFGPEIKELIATTSQIPGAFD